MKYKILKFEYSLARNGLIMFLKRNSPMLDGEIDRTMDEEIDNFCVNLKFEVLN